MWICFLCYFISGCVNVSAVNYLFCDIFEKIFNWLHIICVRGRFSEEEAPGLANFFQFIIAVGFRDASLRGGKVTLCSYKSNRSFNTFHVKINFFKPVIKVLKALLTCQTITQQDAVSTLTILLNQLFDIKVTSNIINWYLDMISFYDNIFNFSFLVDCTYMWIIALINIV